MSHIIGSTTAFLDPGIYQRLECGCILHAHEIDPRGPRLCLILNRERPCALQHSVDDFLPRWWPS